MHAVFQDCCKVSKTEGKLSTDALVNFSHFFASNSIFAVLWNCLAVIVPFCWRPHRAVTEAAISTYVNSLSGRSSKSCSCAKEVSLFCNISTLVWIELPDSKIFGSTFLPFPSSLVLGCSEFLFAREPGENLFWQTSICFFADTAITVDLIEWASQCFLFVNEAVSRFAQESEDIASPSDAAFWKAVCIYSLPRGQCWFSCSGGVQSARVPIRNVCQSSQAVPERPCCAAAHRVSRQTRVPSALAQWWFEGGNIIEVLLIFAHFKQNKKFKMSSSRVQFEINLYTHVHEWKTNIMIFLGIFLSYYDMEFHSSSPVMHYFFQSEKFTQWQENLRRDIRAKQFDVNPNIQFIVHMLVGEEEVGGFFVVNYSAENTSYFIMKFIPCIFKRH